MIVRSNIVSTQTIMCLSVSITAQSDQRWYSVVVWGSEIHFASDLLPTSNVLVLGLGHTYTRSKPPSVSTARARRLYSRITTLGPGPSSELRPCAHGRGALRLTFLPRQVSRCSAREAWTSARAAARAGRDAQAAGRRE